MKRRSWLIFATLVLGSSASPSDNSTEYRKLEEFCFLRYPADNETWLRRDCRHNLDIEVLDVEANANANIFCRANAHAGGVMLSFQPGTYIFEARMGISPWKFVKTLSQKNVDIIRTIIWRFGLSGPLNTKVQFRFHRVFPTGLSRPETTDWIEKIHDANLSLPVKNLRVQYLGSSSYYPETIETGIGFDRGFDPAEGRRSCDYRVTYRRKDSSNETTVVERAVSLIRNMDSTYEFRLFLGNLSRDTNYTVTVQPLQVRLTSGRPQVIVGVETSLDFTTLGLGQDPEPQLCYYDLTVYYGRKICPSGIE